MKVFVATLLISSCAFATKEEDAIKNAAAAAYKQFGMEEMVNEYIKVKVPKELKEVADKVGPFVDIIVRQKIEVKWNF